MTAFIDPNASELIEPVRTTFVPETGYLVVNIDKARYGYIDQPVRWEGRIFQPKSELHITIISLDAEKVYELTSEDNAALAQVQDLITQTDWRFRKLSAFYHVVESPGIETLIQLVEMPALEGFFQSLSGTFGEGFHLPPAHVTLYTMGTEKGIGLPTRPIFDELAQARINPADIRPINTET